MTNRLKQYFPMLRTRTEIMEIIIKDETLKTLFDRLGNRISRRISEYLYRYIRSQSIIRFYD